MAAQSQSGSSEKNSQGKSRTAEVRRIVRALVQSGRHPSSSASSQETGSAQAGGSGGGAGLSDLSQQQLARAVREELQNLGLKVQRGQSPNGGPRSPDTGGTEASGDGDDTASPQAAREQGPSRRSGHRAQGSSGAQSQPQSAGRSRGSSSGQLSAGTGSSAVHSDSSPSAETVANVLTQAQWELSQELEANLKQLRQVINQSEEVARKIERVLGYGSSPSSS